MTLYQTNFVSKKYFHHFTGKRLLQELQEATQSHQVRDEEPNSLNLFFKNSPNTSSKNSKTNNQEPQTKSRKICLLLIEDVDLVFEQDEGFTAALGQLLTMSKRPVILTTTDENALHLQKFVNSHHLVRFRELSAEKLDIWLQLVCLLEGLYVGKEYLGELLDYFKGDVRKTLLQLQFLVEPHVVNEIDRKDGILLNETEHVEDLQDLDFDNVKTDVLKDCDCAISVKNCVVFEDARKSPLPQNMSLETLWWNLPCILNEKNCKRRCQKCYKIVKICQRNIRRTCICRWFIRQNKLRC